jgi:hypothetical protein
VTSLDALNEDFRDFLRELCAQGAEFVVVGAYALAFHGVPRATGDIDLLVRPSAENARRVLRALIRNKRSTGRTKDLADVESLER